MRSTHCRQPDLQRHQRRWGMLPAVGIALNLRAILKKQTWPFLIIGFLLVAYFKISIIGVGLFGVAAALIYMLMNTKKEGAATNGAQE